MENQTPEDMMRSLLRDSYKEYVQEHSTIYMDPFALPLTDGKKSEALYEELREAVKNGENLYPRYIPFKCVDDHTDVSDDKVKEQLMHVIDQVKIDDGFLMFSPESVSATSVNKVIGSPAFIMQALISLEPADTTWKVKVNFEFDGDVVRTLEEFITQKTFKRVESQVITDLTVDED